MFQAKIPNVKDLEVAIMDYDLLTSDDMVGMTTIDLENRILSRARATVRVLYPLSTALFISWRPFKNYITPNIAILTLSPPMSHFVILLPIISSIFFK